MKGQTPRQPTPSSTPAGGQRTANSPLTIALGLIVVIGGFLLSQCSGGGGVAFVPTETPMRSTMTAVAREMTRAMQTALAALPTQTRTARPATGQPSSAIPATAAPLVLVTPISSTSNSITGYTYPMATGASRGFWQVYFNNPSRSRDTNTYFGSIEQALATALNGVTATLDIAAYEFNNPLLTQAVLNAHARGVRVRVVTDDDDGLEDEETTLGTFLNAGIPIVTDERRALMHDKFMILDSAVVWTGSWNYTINDSYRNNNNALVLRSRQAVRNYQAEFDEMFTDGRFGSTSPAQTPITRFNQDGIPIGIYFAAEDAVIPAIIETIGGAQRSIRFMAFSYTVPEITTAILARAEGGVAVQGIFETTGSQTRFSQLTPLFCAGQNVRQDGNPFILHHKVFIIDDTTVMTGSFNFSANATDSNDENLVIISDPALAAQYIGEFNRRWAEATVPTSLVCE